MNKLYNKFKKMNKIYAVSILVIAILIVAVSSATLARFKHRVAFLGSNVWDGTAALSYHSGTGTKSDPYVIATGEQFMFFAENLKDTDYANTYFILKNDIILNDEIFSYNDTNKVTYEKDGVITTVEFNKDSYQDIHKFSTINNFKGTLDGDMHTIYGLFLTSNEDIALFKNLSGTVKNLYLENTLIYGNNIVSALALNMDNAIIENVLINGNIIGSNTDNVISKDFTKEDITITENTTIQRPKTGYSVSLITLSGTYSSANNESILINNETITNGDFIITLDNNSNEDLIQGTTGTITNLKYTITYNNKVSTTFAYESNNSILKNVINKSSVYAKEYASGLIYNASNTKVLRGYNTGLSKANVTSGIIYNTTGTEITNVYFNGTLNGSENYSFIVNNLSGVSSLNNIANLSDNYLVKNSYEPLTINGVSYYDKNILNSSDKDITIVANKIETYLKDLNYLSYEEGYTDDNAWIYEENSMPILFFDDAKNSLAALKIEKYSWNNLSEQVDTIKLNTDLAFTIEETSDISRIKEVYYSVQSNVSNPNEISWTAYNGKVTISEKGYYVIYVKLVDNNDKITYINSDLIALKDVSAVSLNINEQKYDSLKSTLSNQYVPADPSFSIEIYDQNSVKDLYYLISNTVLNETELNASVWNIYPGQTVVPNADNSIVYIKVVDHDLNSTFINSDIISKKGFMQTNLTNNAKDIYIANNNKVKLNFKFETTTLVEGTKVLNFNLPLPKGTSLILNDNTTSKVYKYDIIDASNKIYLNNFKEIGIKESKYFKDIATQNEDYTITVDFKNAELINNIENLNIQLMIEKSKTPILSTLTDSLVNINVIKDNPVSKSISTSFTGPIYYSKDMNYNINILVNRNNLSSNILSAVDNTTLVARITDNMGIAIEDKYLNNMEFKINDTKYYYDKGKVKFDIKESNSVVLDITTYNTNNTLEKGEYNLEIGLINNDTEMYYITIPIIVEENSDDIIIESKTKSIRKASSAKLEYEVINDAGYDIKIVLYKKKQLTAYNQDYELINIDEYLNNITKEEGKITIDLNAKNLENNGYMIGFELYKENEKIGEITKKFIVR